MHFCDDLWNSKCYICIYQKYTIFNNKSKHIPLSPLNNLLSSPLLLFPRTVSNSQNVVSRFLGVPETLSGRPWGLPFSNHRSVWNLIFFLCFNQDSISQKTDFRSKSIFLMLDIKEVWKMYNNANFLLFVVWENTDLYKILVYVRM